MHVTQREYRSQGGTLMYANPHESGGKMVKNDPNRFMRSPRNRGFVYFIVSADEYVKIGYSKYIHMRLKDLQVGNPHNLSLEYFEEGSHEDEQAYHRKFYSYRKRGEWFRHSGELKSWLRHKRDRQQQKFNEEELEYG